MDFPITCFFEEETEKIINKSKNFIILSDKNKKYNILFENNGAILSITTTHENNLEKVIYKNTFTLYDIQKVKLFQTYDNIDECLLEIFNILDENKAFIKEIKDKLELIIPLNSKKYPQIIFALNKKEKTDSEKIKELYNIINTLTEENNHLKKTNYELKAELENLKNYQFQEIKLIGTKEEVDGILCNLNIFEKEKFNKYIPKYIDLNENNIYFNLKLNLKNTTNTNEIKAFFNVNKEKFNSLKYEISGNTIILNYFIPIKNKYAFEFFEQLIDIDELIFIKTIFKSALQFKDIFEFKSFKDLLNKFLKFQFYMNGITINFKLFLNNLINEIKTTETIRNSNFYDMFNTLHLILYWRKTYLYFKKFNFYEEFQKIKKKKQ